MRLHDGACYAVIIKHVYNILLPLVITALMGRKGISLYIYIYKACIQSYMYKRGISFCEWILSYITSNGVWTPRVSWFVTTCAGSRKPACMYTHTWNELIWNVVRMYLANDKYVRGDIVSICPSVDKRNTHIITI